MIIFTSRLIKIALLVMVLLLTEKYRKKNMCRIPSLFLAAGISFCACVALCCTHILPPLTDEVTLTAFGEHNENARREEIFLSGYTVDGKTFSAAKSLQVVEGKWFWCGEEYCWRIPTDTRQPEGLTQSIKMKIPVGWARALVFSANEWRGMVQIEVGDKIWMEDAYSQDPQMSYVEIGKSKTALLIENQMIELAVFGIAFTLFTLFFIFTLKAIKRWESSGTSESILRHRYYVMVMAAYALLVGGVMFVLADNASLWYDEMFQIGEVRGTLRQAIVDCLEMVEYTPPLHTIIAWVWYRIAPYGERYLLLNNIFSTVVSIFLMAIIIERHWNRESGAIAVALMSSSYMIWKDVALEFRAYSFLLLFSCLTLYCHIRRTSSENKKRWQISFAVSLVLLSMSHYFGMLLCGVYFLADLYLLYKRKIRWQTGFTYFPMATVSMIWLAAVYKITLQYKAPEEIASWYPVPTLSHLKSMLEYLLGDSKLVCGLLLLSAAWMINRFIQSSEHIFEWSKFYIHFSSFSIIGVLGLLFLYGNFVNQKSTLWQGRYFVILIPFIYIVISVGLTEVIEFIVGEGERKRIATSVAALFLTSYLFVPCLLTIKNNRSNEPFRESADWIYKYSDCIFSEDTIIIACVPFTDAWNEYYIFKQGRRDTLRAISAFDVDEKLADEYETIFLQEIHSNSPAWLKDYLEENFTLKTSKYNTNLYQRVAE